MIGRIKLWLTGATRSLTVWTSLALLTLPDALTYVAANYSALTPYLPVTLQPRLLNAIGLAMFLLRIKTVQSLAAKGAALAKGSGPAALLVLTLGSAFLTGCSRTDAQSTGDVLSWINPTQRTDLTPFTTQADTLVMWGKSGGPYADGSVVVAFPLITVTVANNYTGTRCYVAIARDTPVTDPVTKAVTQLVSGPSNEVCKTITAVPKAPTGLAVK